MKNMNMFVKKVFGAALAALALAVLSFPVSAQRAAEIGNLNNTKLEGTWMTTVTFEDDFALKVLFTFMPGREELEGTLIDSNEFQLTPNPVCTADQGVWKKTAIRSFIATHYAFCFDAENGYEPAGSVKVRDNIQLNLKGNAFTGTQHIEIYDVDGNITDTFDADMEGTKIVAEPPPALSGRSTSNRGAMFQKHFRFFGKQPQK